MYLAISLPRSKALKERYIILSKKASRSSLVNTRDAIKIVTNSDFMSTVATHPWCILSKRNVLKTLIMTRRKVLEGQGREANLGRRFRKNSPKLVFQCVPNHYSWNALIQWHPAASQIRSKAGTREETSNQKKHYHPGVEETD